MLLLASIETSVAGVGGEGGGAGRAAGAVRGPSYGGIVPCGRQQRAQAATPKTTSIMIRNRFIPEDSSVLGRDATKDVSASDRHCPTGVVCIAVLESVKGPAVRRGCARAEILEAKGSPPHVAVMLETAWVRSSCEPSPEDTTNCSVPLRMPPYIVPASYFKEGCIEVFFLYFIGKYSFRSVFKIGGWVWKVNAEKIRGCVWDKCW